MKTSINNLVREFYLGDNAAWEKITDLISNEMSRRLDYKFGNLPEAKRGEIVPNEESLFFAKVVLARREVENQISQNGQSFSTEEIENKKIEFCTEATKFDLDKGMTFDVWMWNKIRFRAIDSLRQNGFVAEIEEETDLEFISPQIPANPVNSPFSVGGIDDENTQKIKNLLRTALIGDELIYLELWFEHFGEPPVKEVKEAIKNETGRDVTDVYVTGLKQSFLMKCYLKLLDHISVANALASLFQRLMKISEIDDEMFGLMMENIWNDFYHDKEATSISKAVISPDLWNGLEALKHKKERQKKIMVPAYRYFRHRNPRPFFCFKIESYSDNRFGSQIRELFMEGGADE
jgi:ribosomal protein S24E